MTLEGEAPSDSHAPLPVLLVVLGGLGDWCIRRVLQHALEFEKASSDKVVTIIVDVHPIGINSDDDTYEQWMDAADRWIVRRLIEQTAEEADQPLRDAVGDALKDLDWGFTERLAKNPMLPDPTTPGGDTANNAIAAFIDLLGEIFQSAYEGDDARLNSLVESRMKTTLNRVEKAWNQNAEQTLQKLDRQWRVRQKATAFDDVRADMIAFVKKQIRDLAEKSREKIDEVRNRLKAYLEETVSLGGTQMYRYWRSDTDTDNTFHCLDNGDRLPVAEAMLDLLAREYRIIVYAATPPNTYPKLLQQWSPYAERIAFEKPIAGLLESNGQGALQLTQTASPRGVETTKRIREAVEEAFRNPNRIETLQRISLSSVDHYNSKWTVAAIEWLKRRKIVDHILKRPSRICIQVLEGGILPRGRFQFYNGVGGALADMLSHLIQPLRSLTGHATIGELLSTLEIVQVERARYLLNEEHVLDAFGAGFAAQKDLADKLAKDTETFGVVHLKFNEGEWKHTDVFIRTGKGFLPQSKTMVIEASDDDGPVALICDIDRRRICLADHGLQPPQNFTNDLPAHVWMVTREFDVPGLIRDHYLSPDTKEYFSVFSALCSPEELDGRFFPSVEDASQVCDFFYKEIIDDRLKHPNGLEDPNVYEADYLGEEVRSWLATEAGWGQLGREKERGH
jgi:glucose-6-phosphate 1-dehydrogenase